MGSASHGACWLDAKTAPLTPEYRKIYEDNVKDQAAGGQGTDPTFTCLAPGMPRVLTKTPTRRSKLW